MKKFGGEPDSLFTKGMRVVDVSPHGKAEIIEVQGKLTVRPRTASSLIKISREIVSDYRDVTLEDLRGGIEFIPKFHNGKSFIVASEGIYVRGPYGSENFRQIESVRNMVLELGIRGEEEVMECFLKYGGNLNQLKRDLKETGKFGMKEIT
jgi:hypothetical protein